ncbi:hypothetical protein KCP71_25555 [Salmonella enterica subsp. enterica]|nr:hypothetical protein KCP71_25555 [Salmonella enterica subsp. enterica]
MTASEKHLPLAICCQHRSAFTAGGTRLAWLMPTVNDGDLLALSPGSRGGSAGDLSAH